MGAVPSSVKTLAGIVQPVQAPRPWSKIRVHLWLKIPCNSPRKRKTRHENGHFPSCLYVIRSRCRPSTPSVPGERIPRFPQGGGGQKGQPRRVRGMAQRPGSLGMFQGRLPIPGPQFPGRRLQMPDGSRANPGQRPKITTTARTGGGGAEIAGFTARGTTDFHDQSSK